jgi:tetratricopeptide (TPR) repeat protein
LTTPYEYKFGGNMLFKRIIICGIFFFGLCFQTIAAEKEYVKLYNQGVVANKKGDFAEAIRYYSKAIALKPDSAELFYVRGRAYVEKEQYDYAISDFTRAITLKPAYAEAYNHRGVTYIGKGQKPQAMSDFKKACELGYKFGCANADKFKSGK